MGMAIAANGAGRRPPPGFHSIFKRVSQA